MSNSAISEEDLSAISPQNPKRHYWQYLIVIGIFVFLPVYQFTMFQENYDNTICYYNKKCMKSLGSIEAFNNIISNILYIVLALLFMLTVRFSRKADDGCGIHRDHSIYYSMGICLCFVGIFSGLYHVCPSPLNFQFDTLFMYISGAIMFIAIYYKRHVDKIPSAFRTYCMLAGVYYLSTISLIRYRTGAGMALWVIADILIIYILLHGSINIYYATDIPFGIGLVKHVYKSIKESKNTNYPKLIFVLIINLFTITMIFYATFSKSNVFTNWFLSLFIINMLFYFIYYLIQKVLKFEVIKWYIWLMLISDIIILGTALLFFEHGVSDKFLPHSESDKFNEPCVLFGYFDTHDIWHFLSAIGLYIFLNIIYFIDDDLKHTPRTAISIF